MAAPDLIAGPAQVSGNGAVLHVRRRGDTWTVEFMAEPRTSPQPLWFHIECEGKEPRQVRFVWLNAGGCLGLGGRRSLQGVRPVVRLDGGPWRRVAEARARKRRQTGLTLSFSTPTACRRVSAAFCYPYGPADIENTLQETAEVWAREAIGLTGRGRALPRLRATAPAKPKDPPRAYLVARQHAGETPGSWVLDGLLRAVAGAGRGDPLRRVEWWCVPMVDLDGVVEGNYGKDALPWDFNRAWTAMPMRPEILCIQQDMRRFATRAGRRLVLDLHAPGGGERRFYQFLCRDERPDEQREAGASVTPYLAAEFPGVPADELAVVPSYASRWGTEDTATTWAWEGLDHTPAASIETTYQAIGDGPWLEPDDYREIGRRIARAAAGWLLESGVRGR